MIVSIIIPCYNVQDYIIECVESCYAQTYKNIEVICIDNNSTDNTWQELIILKEKYPQLVLDKEPKSGAPSARNKGLELAKGDWIQFLDADDLLLPSKIEHQLNIIKETNCDLIYANSIRRTVDGGEVKSGLNDNDLWLNLFNSSLGNTCSNLWKKEILKELEGWDESLTSSQEYNLLFRYLQKTDKFVLDKKHLTIIRERESGQISKKDIKGNVIRYLDLRLQIIDYLNKKEEGYYMKNRDKYKTLLFDLLRTIYPINKQHAIMEFKKNFDNSFIPLLTTVTTSSYITIFKIFGFEYTEKIKQYFRGSN